MNNELQVDVLKRQNTLLKMKNEKLSANLDYVAMMTEVDIPTEDEDAQPEI